MNTTTPSPSPEGSDAGTRRLAPDACWELLAESVVGRLAVIVEQRPKIFPINYVLDGKSVVFRTAAGTAFWGSVGQDIAIEADGYQADSQSAWSVVVSGQAHVIVAPEQIAAVDALGLEPWQSGEKHNYIRLTPGSVTGRRFHTTRPGVWHPPEFDPATSSFQ
ncbi:pyridoxamine 5'-phosphate oxidase family protein [Pseudarthrobacter sp. BIM B-2242]|uniref:pyridoxamine 5'-phosphate oxidase family protein n=1 Tax=Pseudarthrobacter sp. BIM B-2242 TaxID=2772401 RepID=UPI00168BD54F|nr:pyridoxamine 5'-phosphate oxidase family protein [Pseudarthrobacter sp. BIM B-2242]QOD05063.1 pyridoxamine 5'-phosphate oxidase family protein [Pseudarthrobacter sp. BIM B-2242]